MMPGMFDFAYAPASTNYQKHNLLRSSGVRDLSKSSTSDSKVVAPSSTANLFLADESVATAWLHNMI